jgi:ribonuclease HII
MAKEAKAKYLKVPVRYKGETLEVGTEIAPDHAEYADMEKQGWLADSKALAEAKPEAIAETLTEVSEQLIAAKKTIADLTKDNETLTEALNEAKDKIAVLETPAEK